MLYVSLLTLTCAMSLVLPATSAESVLSRYRGVTLGDSVQLVTVTYDRERTQGLTNADLHEAMGVVRASDDWALGRCRDAVASLA